MEFHTARAQSAPPIRTSYTGEAGTQFRAASNALKFVRRLQGSKDNGTANGLSFQETVSRLQTTIRMAQRFKERRRTEADITIYKKPSALLASEMMVRKMTQEELEMSLTRTCRPTASFLARTASNRRINASDIYVPPNVSRVQYFTVGSGRFKGQGSLKEKEVEKLISRLSAYNPRRRPAESKRVLPKETKKRLGPLASYRWNGVRNC